MKKQNTLLTIILVLCSTLMMAQAPAMIDFQALARDVSGDPITNQLITVKASILDGPVGFTIWQETQNVTTDDYGLFTIKLGNNIPIAVNWGDSFHYIKIEIDPEGGSSFIDMGTTQLLSVPYALYATNVENNDDADADPENEFQELSISGSDLSISDGNTVTLPGGTSFWEQNGDDIYYLTGNVGVGTETPDYGANVADAKVLTINAADVGGVDDHPAILEFRGSDANDGGVLGKIEFFNWANGVNYDLAKIEATRSDGINQAYSSLNFFTRMGGPASYTSKMTIDHNGYVGVGTTTPLVRLHSVLTNDAGVLGSDLGSLYSPTQYLSPAIAGFSDNNTADISYGVWGHANSTTSPYNMGVFGEGGGGSANNYGIYGVAYGQEGSNYSICVYGDDEGSASNNYAGYFSGAVHINGTLSKSGGSFKIDHPLDPENKFLIHSFVESPDMMNIYNGNITTDDNGMAIVELPSYFEAENIDFRYQLTVVGEFAQAIVKEKIADNKFTIMTDKPNIEVSWQVTGVRNDKWAQQNRIVPEQKKQGVEKGKYLNPEVFGKSKSEGMPVGIK